MSASRPTIADGLELHQTDDGLVVYQQANDAVHYLNHTAAIILQLCDGTRDTEAIAAFLADGYGMADPPIEEARACIDDLLARGLAR